MSALVQGSKAALAVMIVAAASAAAAATPQLPDVGAVQAAYERAASADDARHDRDLKVLGVDCEEAGATRYTCTVGFAKTQESGNRVYLDSALVERRGADWILLQGLCRRLL